MDVESPCVVVATVSVSPSVSITARLVRLQLKPLRFRLLFELAIDWLCYVAGARPVADLDWEMRVDSQTVLKMRRSECGLNGALVAATAVQLPDIGPCRRNAYLAGRRDLRHELAGIGPRVKYVQPPAAIDALLPNVG